MDTREQFYQARNNALSDMYSMKEDELTADEWNNAYPIYNELRSSPERYISQTLINEGGMKYVYRVHDTCSDRDVAKAILKEPDKTIARERFLREARISASLQHPNILPIYDIGIDYDDTPFFTMELLKGETLGSVLKNLSHKNLSYQEKYTQLKLLETFLKVCDAISYAHSCGVIHLDLKPENIYINDHGQVHVCDWGLSRNIDDEDEYGPLYNTSSNIHTTLCGRERGTPGFMAPEQCIPGSELSYQADIYALGSILYSLLTYTLPVDGETIETLLANTESGLIIPFSERERGSSISPGLQAVVLKALCIDPATRYQTVDELQNDLVNYLHGYATEAENASFVTQFKLLVERNKAISLTIATALSLIIFIFSFSFININKERTKADSLRQIAEQNLELFKHEQERTNSQQVNIDRLLLKTTFASRLNELKHTIKLIEQGLKREMPDEKRDALYAKKAQLHFILQEYNEAVKLFSKVKLDFWTEAYNRAARQSMKWKTDSETLTDRQMAEVIRRLSSKGLPIVKAVYEFQMRQGKRGENPEEYAQLAKAMIDTLNYTWDRRWEPLKLTKRKEGYHLDLSHTPYHLLRSQHETLLNVLAPLNLYSIDLSHSAFFDFYQLVESGVKEVTFVGCKLPAIGMKRAKQIQNAGIKKLILDSKNLPPGDLEHFKAITEVEDVSKPRKK